MCFYVFRRTNYTRVDNWVPGSFHVDAKPDLPSKQALA
jgi:hypothetical protein